VVEHNWRKIGWQKAITYDVVKIFNVNKKDAIVVFHEEPHRNWYAEGIRLWFRYMASGLFLM
jgi:tautomerase-like protein